MATPNVDVVVAEFRDALDALDESVYGGPRVGGFMDRMRMTVRSRKPSTEQASPAQVPPAQAFPAQAAVARRVSVDDVETEINKIFQVWEKYKGTFSFPAQDSETSSEQNLFSSVMARVQSVTDSVQKISNATFELRDGLNILPIALFPDIMIEELGDEALDHKRIVVYKKPGQENVMFSQLTPPAKIVEKVRACKGDDALAKPLILLWESLKERWDVFYASSSNDEEADCLQYLTALVMSTALHVLAGTKSYPAQTLMPDFVSSEQKLAIALYVDLEAHVYGMRMFGKYQEPLHFPLFLSTVRLDDTAAAAVGKKLSRADTKELNKDQYTHLFSRTLALRHTWDSLPASLKKEKIAKAWNFADGQTTLIGMDNLTKISAAFEKSSEPANDPRHSYVNIAKPLTTREMLVDARKKLWKTIESKIPGKS